MAPTYLEVGSLLRSERWRCFGKGNESGETKTSVRNTKWTTRIRTEVTALRGYEGSYRLVEPSEDTVRVEVNLYRIFKNRPNEGNLSGATVPSSGGRRGAKSWFEGLSK